MKLKIVPHMVVIALILLMAALAMHPVSAQPPLGMISYWKFDEGGGTVAHDSIGTYEGTITNPNWSPEGRVGSCIQSSPMGATYTSVPNSPLNVAGDQLTVEAWVYLFGSSYLEGQGNGAYVAINEEQGGLNVGGWWRGAFQFSVVTVENGWRSATSSQDFPAGTWYHMVGVYNGFEMRLYSNGVLINTAPQSGTIVQSSEPFWMGRYPNGYDWAYYGKIDEVAIYNRALTAEEIQQHYQNGLDGLGYFSDPTMSTQGLIETIKTWNLPKGTENSLTSKLQNAIQSLEKGQQNATVNKLNAFIDEVQAQKNKKLTNGQADTLITEAQRIINATQG